MTVPTALSKVIYEGNSLTTEFAVPFALLDKEHIFCLLADEQGAETPTSNFMVSGLDKVIYPLNGPPLPEGSRLIIYRWLPITQGTSLLEGGAFYASTHEEKFDYLCMVDQQQQEQIDRALKLAMSSQDSSQAMMDELLAARDMSLEAAGSAETSAGQAANDALRAETAARQTAEDVFLVSSLSDVQVLASQAVHLRKSWVLKTNAPAGQIMTMPVHYWPGRNHLDLRYDGMACYLRSAGVEASGEYQFEEVGEISAPSNQVRLNFTAEAGSVFEAWVLASITQEAFDSLEASVRQVNERVAQAETAALQAADDLEQVEALAQFFPDLMEAEPGNVLQVNQQGSGLLWAASSAFSSRLDYLLIEELPAGTAFAVPPYKAGQHMLKIYLDGLLCLAGEDGSVCQYQETNNNSIIFHDTLTAGRQISACVEG